MYSSGESIEAEITATMLELVEMVRPKLVRDRMFLVGLGTVEDKLMEINVLSPGGLGSSRKFADVNFADLVIRDLERKVKCKSYYGSNIRNAEIATL